MRWNDLPRSLVFGALAAASWLPVAVLVAPALGFGLALKLHAALCVAAYLAGAGPRPSPRTGAFALLVGLGLAILVDSPGVALTGLGALLATARSGRLWRLRPARALVLELTLVLGGLKLAALAAAPSVLGVALGFWTFFLVQGAYFVVGGVEARPGPAGSRDAFEVARDRALRVLEDLA
jgi:hypothetical protein